MQIISMKVCLPVSSWVILLLLFETIPSQTKSVILFFHQSDLFEEVEDEDNDDMDDDVGGIVEKRDWYIFYSTVLSKAEFLNWISYYFAYYIPQNKYFSLHSSLVTLQSNLTLITQLAAVFCWGLLHCIWRFSY